MKEFTFLTYDQVFGKEQLEILRIYGTKCAVTDFSILLGVNVDASTYINEDGNTRSGRIGEWWTKTPCDSLSIEVYVNWFGKGYNKFIDSRKAGARPVLPYSSILSVSSNKVRGRNGILEVEYGEYPQTTVSKTFSKTLEKAFATMSHSNPEMKTTGKVYTTDSVMCDEKEPIPFQPRTHIEYEYNGKKYIRFVGDSNCSEIALNDGRKIKNGDVYWVSVEPIVWMIDEKSDIALSKKIIFSGVQFHRKRNYNGDFDRTDIKKFMDTYFAKEILTDKDYINTENNNLVLTRDFFKPSLDKIRSKTICIIPNLKTNPITKIASEALMDWENLEILIVPPTVKEIAIDAINHKKLKLIISNVKFEGYEDIDYNSYNESTISLFQALDKIEDCSLRIDKLEEKNDIDVEQIDEKKDLIIQKIEEYQKEFLSELQKLSEQKQQFTNLLLQFEKITGLIQRNIDIIKPLYDEIKKHIDDSINKLLADTTKELEDASNKLREQTEFSSSELKKMRDNINEIIKNFQDGIAKYDELTQNTIKREIDNQIKRLDEVVNKIIDDISRKSEKLTDIIVDEALERIRDKTPYKNLVINLNGVEKLKMSGVVLHKSFEEVLKVLSLKLHPLLVGPAGSGKNVILEQAAKALDLKFHYVNDVTEEHKVMGFVDANGNFQKTQFFEAFTNGGLIMIDEMDNSHPSALLAINAALGTGYHHYLTFPDGKLYESNSNFYLAAAANTYGTGSDAIYCGRSALDGASLNRFIPIFIDYDRELERNLIKHTEILSLYWKVRESIQKNKIRHVISTRNIVNADKMIESNMFDYSRIFDFTIIQSMTEDDLRMIIKDLNDESDYMIREFINHLNNKGITINEYDDRNSEYGFRRNAW